MSIMSRVFLSLFVLTLFAGVAHAVVLVPDDTVALSGTTSALRPELAGVVQEDPLTTLFIQYPGGDPAFTVAFQGRVYVSDTLNTIVFAPRLTSLSDDGSGWALVRLELKGYAGWACDVDYRTDGEGTIGPSPASRSLDGDIVTFDFTSNPVGNGQESLFMFNLTDAPAYQEIHYGAVLYFENSQQLTKTVWINYFAPIPEPATLGFLTLGGLLMLRRRRA